MRFSITRFFLLLACFVATFPIFFEYPLLIGVAAALALSYFLFLPLYRRMRQRCINRTLASLPKEVVWLRSNNPAVQALTEAGVLKLDTSSQIYDVEEALEALTPLHILVLDSIARGRLGRHWNQNVIETLRDAAARWHKEQQWQATAADGLVDIEHASTTQWYVLDAYRLGTQLLVDSLANKDLSEEHRAEVLAKLAELAQCCKRQLQALRDEDAKVAGVMAQEAIQIADFYLEKDKELTLHTK